MTKNHPRVANGAASDSETHRYQKLLDAEILPRLERPGRYLGPFEARGIATESAQITRLALLWPSVPESHHTPAGLAPVKLALESRNQLPVELVCVPAPDAVSLLTDRGLPVFSRPSWIPLASFESLLLWIEHPGQVLGLLTLLGLGGIPARVSERDTAAPELLAAGPAAAKLAGLLKIWCDAVLPIADPRELATHLAERSIREATPSAPAPRVPLADPRASTIERIGDVPIAEGRVRPRLNGPPSEQLALPQAGFGGARFTRVYLGAAAEGLRERLALIDSARLRKLCAEALAHESGQLEVELTLGLPGETAADRAAIPGLIDHLVRMAPRGERQLRILISAALPDGDGEGIAPAILESALEEIRARLSVQKLRLHSVNTSEFRVSAGLLERGPEGAALVERAHAGGAWHGDVDGAFHPTRWPELLTASELEASTPKSAALADAAEAASNGLESAPALPPTLDENGHPVAGKDNPPLRNDRWRRWSALVPREYQLRVVFEKRGSMRHLSHREMADLLIESCRRAGVPLAVVGLVSPRPKLSFGPSLPVGVEGREEFVDLSLTRKAPGVVAALNEHLPQGLLVRRARYLSPGAKCAHAPVQRARYFARVPVEQRTTLLKGVASFHSRENWKIERRKSGESTGIDLKSQITRLHTDESSAEGIHLYFECDLSAEGLKLRPQEFVAALLECPVEDVCTLTLRREELLSRGGEPMGPWRTPMQLVELATLRSRQMVKRYS